MRYHFFICKPQCTGAGWIAGISNELWAYLAGGEYRTDCFAPFDVERLCKLLRVASGEQAGFAPKFKYRQVCGLPLVSITTEYHKAQEVAASLSMCLPDDGLILFDGEMECCANISKTARAEFIKARLAYQRYRLALFNEFNAASVWRHNKGAMVHKLGECYGYECHRDTKRIYARCSIDTVVSFVRGKSPADSVLRFNDLLRKLATEQGESVYCKDGCFIVENANTDYQLRFVIEGYGKSPEWTGWIEDGNVKIERLHRMGIYRVRKELARMGKGEEDYARSRLYFPERFNTRGDWRNPADRFADSYKISKQLKKQNLDIIYGRHPYRNNGEFVFYACDKHDLGWDAWKTSSSFVMPEEQAAPLLAIFESVIPCYYEYYYSTFHFRKEEVAQILERIKVVRQQVINDPCDSSLGTIRKRLMRSDFAWKRPDGTTPFRSHEKVARKILSKNRFRVLALIDFFAWWLSEQRNDGFYVAGP